MEPSAFLLILKTHLEPSAFRPGGTSLTVSQVPFLAKEFNSDAMASIHLSASGEFIASVYVDDSMEEVVVAIITLSVFECIHLAKASKCSTCSSGSQVHSSYPVHLTLYRGVPSITLSSIIASTSHSVSLSFGGVYSAFRISVSSKTISREITTLRFSGSQRR